MKGSASYRLLVIRLFFALYREWELRIANVDCFSMTIATVVRPKVSANLVFVSFDLVAVPLQLFRQSPSKISGQSTRIYCLYVDTVHRAIARFVSSSLRNAQF